MRVEDVTVGGGEGAPESNDDSRRVGRIAVGIGVIIIVLLVLWWLWPRFGTVPNVVGLKEETARAVIQKAGYTIGVVATRTIDATEAGRVLVQVPPAGLRVALGQEVDFTVSEPSGVSAGADTPPQSLGEALAANGVVVPFVTGQDLTLATRRLQAVGLLWSTEYQSSGLAVGKIVHQAPAASVVVPENTTVRLIVSSGTSSRGSASVRADGPSVPDVLGMSEGRARSTLSASGYGMRVVYAPSTTTSRGQAFWQSAGPGPDPNAHGTVEVWISMGPPTKGAGYKKPPDSKPFWSVPDRY